MNSLVDAPLAADAAAPADESPVPQWTNRFASPFRRPAGFDSAADAANPAVRDLFTS